MARTSGLRKPGPAALPPFADPALGALDLARYERDKQEFFASDVTAAHLSERIAASPPQTAAVTRGSFGWVVRELALAPVECFVLAVALLPMVDSAAGSVIATCLNDPARTDPTFALAQRLWDSPDELVRCFDPAHPLLSHGLLVAHGSPGWNAVLAVPALVARELLFPASRTAARRSSRRRRWRTARSAATAACAFARCVAARPHAHRPGDRSAGRAARRGRGSLRCGERQQDGAAEQRRSAAINSRRC